MNCMSKIYTSAEMLIGKTPLLELCGVEKEFNACAKILAKLEFYNPGGSVKDRVAMAMIDEAEKSGKITKGSVIIEPTSGSTGIGLAMVASIRGYKAVIVMPDSMSPERIKLMKAYGAEVVLTPGAEGMPGAIRKAEELSNEYENSIVAGQFDNPANPAAHYATTGPEIWADTKGKVDIFIAGVGTGGTLTGTGKYLKEQDPHVQIIAVEPANSPLLSQGRSGSHGLQGIGANFVPSVLDTHIYDEVLTVTEEEAYAAGRLMGATEGILVGISSGAALHAAILVAQRPENAGKRIVVLLPDSGDRYLSTNLYK